MEASRPARFPSCARSATTSNGPATSCHRAQPMTWSSSMHNGESRDARADADASHAGGRWSRGRA